MFVAPESDATGALPGTSSTPPSFLAGALSAPRPWVCCCCFWNFALAAWPPLEGGSVYKQSGVRRSFAYGVFDAIVMDRKGLMRCCEVVKFVKRECVLV